MKFAGKASKFNYSILGVAVHEDKVLLCKQGEEGLWTLPGGRVRFFESSIDTLKKVMKEDLDTDIHIERLIWVAENSYVHDGTDCSELAFYYLIDFPLNSGLYGFEEPSSINAKGKTLVFQWHAIDKLEQLPIFPEFLRTGLKSIPNGTEHIRNKIG